MEEVIERFPHLGDKIMKELDYQSLVKCKEASRELCEFFDNGRVLWKQMILKNITGILSIECVLLINHYFQES